MGRDQGLHLTELKNLYRESVFFPWSKQEGVEPLFVKEADGVYLTLDNGSRLIDMKSQSFSANLGHNHRGMKAAMVKAAGEARVLSPESFCEDRLSLALKLKEISPSNNDIKLSKVFYTLGGAEANENAIKMARLYTKKHKIITRYRSYHGATLATINFSGDYRRIALDSAITGVVRFPDPYPRGSGQKIDTVRLLQEIIEIEGEETIAAVMLEGITGANGVFIPDKDYWPRIRKLCSEKNIVLIADEVLSGFFRTGTWFGINHFDITPDIITMSKGLTAGYAPLGALLIRQEIAEHFNNETLWCGLTQYGNAFSCATARAAISFYEEPEFRKNLYSRSQELHTKLAALKERHEIIAEVRNIGLLAAIDLRKNARDETPLIPYRATGGDLMLAQKLQKCLKDAGISVIVRFGSIIVAPPLIIKQHELDDGINALDQGLTAFRKAL